MMLYHMVVLICLLNSSSTCPVTMWVFLEQCLFLSYAIFFCYWVVSHTFEYQPFPDLLSENILLYSVGCSLKGCFLCSTEAFRVCWNPLHFFSFCLLFLWMLLGSIIISIFQIYKLKSGGVGWFDNPWDCDNGQMHYFTDPLAQCTGPQHTALDKWGLPPIMGLLFLFLFQTWF